MYIIIWRYLVTPGKEREFESVYGREGDWVRLFQNADGYRGTELLRDLSATSSYTTIDRWTDRVSHEFFLRKYENEYKTLDVRCHALTVSEQQVGSFESTDGTQNWPAGFTNHPMK